MVPAPGRFSTTTDLPLQCADSRSARMRATTSVGAAGRERHQDADRGSGVLQLGAGLAGKDECGRQSDERDEHPHSWSPRSGWVGAILKLIHSVSGNVIAYEVPHAPPPLEKGRSSSPALGRARRVGIKCTARELIPTRRARARRPPLFKGRREQVAHSICKIVALPICKIVALRGKTALTAPRVPSPRARPRSPRGRLRGCRAP